MHTLSTSIALYGSVPAFIRSWAILLRRLSMLDPVTSISVEILVSSTLTGWLVELVLPAKPSGRSALVTVTVTATRTKSSPLGVPVEPRCRISIERCCIVSVGPRSRIPIKPWPARRRAWRLRLESWPFCTFKLASSQKVFGRVLRTLVSQVARLAALDTFTVNLCLARSRWQPKRHMPT